MKKLVLAVMWVPLLFAQASEKQDPRAIIEKVRMWRLTQELDLSTEQTAALFPKLNELRKIEQDYTEEKRQVLVDLKKLLDQDAPDEAPTFGEPGVVVTGVPDIEESVVAEADGEVPDIDGGRFHVHGR